MKFLSLLAATSALAIGSAHATTVVSMEGDADCFGLGGVCADGAGYRDDLGGSFFADNSDVSDPAGTDVWDAFGDLSFTHMFDLTGLTATSAAATIKVAGIADFSGDATFSLNGTQIGLLPQNNGSNGFQETRTFTFGFSTALLSTGMNVVNLVLSPAGGGDGYVVDFTKIEISTSEIPLPGAAPLMLAGLAGLGARKLRRNKSA